MKTKETDIIEEIKKEGQYFCASGGNKIWLKTYPENLSDTNQTTTIFLHGLSGSSFPFEKFFDYFKKKKCPVIIYDQRGHGFSQHVADCDYQLELFCEDLKDIIDKNKLKKVNLVGHCFGSLVAIKFYERYPEYVNSLILISADPRPRREMRNKLFREVLLESENMVKKRLSGIYFHKREKEVDYTKFRYAGDWYIPRMIEDFEKTSVEVMYKTLEELLQLDLTEAVTKISVPTLIIHGEKDSVFSVKNAYFLHALIKNSKIKVFSKANHVNYVVDPKSKLPALVYRFLKKASKE